MPYDFSGWATRNDLRCSDGRTIRHNAFKDCDGMTVPLVWNHRHEDASNVLGHALLENRDEGVYTYCEFNNTPNGQNAKRLVQHGDVRSLSIYANQLTQRGGDVVHGNIREVSLVLAGANPGAYIDSILSHSEFGEEEAIIYTGDEFYLSHADEEMEEPEMDREEDGETIEDIFNTLDEKQKKAVYAIVGLAVEQAKGGSMKHSDDEDEEDDDSEETIQDVFDTLTEKQKKVVYAIVGMAIENKNAEGGNDSDMKHNVFDNDMEQNDYLSHAEMGEIFADARRYGSLKDSVLAHGITNIDYMFPDAQNVTKEPGFVQRNQEWVGKVMNGVHHTPFSRIKSMFADITADEARAKGYVKGNQKTEEVFSMLKRTTTPTTIYKKQKIDRDDAVDITDFDVVAWLKAEMRGMLDEEIARAILVGDGRSSSSNDKINPLNIRPIWGDANLYTLMGTYSPVSTATNSEVCKEFIQSCVRARVGYEGSGTPTCFMTEEMLVECLLMEDKNGRVIYETPEKLANALRVKEIVTVPVMNGLYRTDSDFRYDLSAIIVNLDDYNVGADKGGAVNMFDDFDIDYNAQKYLIETRCSGALIKPHSAIVIERVGELNLDE